MLRIDNLPGYFKPVWEVGPARVVHGLEIYSQGRDGYLPKRQPENQFLSFLCSRPLK